MEKKLTIKQRIKIYQKLAIKIAKNINKYEDNNKFSLCLDLRDEFEKFFNIKYYYYYSNTPKLFPEYGLINPDCISHENDITRIYALLLAIEIAKDSKI